MNEIETNLAELVDSSMPIQFYGGEQIISDDPVLVSLARQHKNERLRLVSVTGPVCYEIDTNDTHKFVEFISNSEHQATFSENLQGLCVDKFGRGLLTGWMSIKEFKKWIPASAPEHLESIFDQLRAVCDSLELLNMTELYFDLYPKNATANFTKGRKYQ